jgi:hypothetical protein
MPSASERYDIWLPRGQDRYGEAIRKLAQLDPVWLAVLFCYCAVFGGILVYSGFLPYTFDNNESFSAFWHARNMYLSNQNVLASERSAARLAHQSGGLGSRVQIPALRPTKSNI